MAWLIHSAEGSEWKKHKYIKRTGEKGKLEDTGVYYYADSYKGGRHLPKGDKSSSSDGTSDDKEKEFGNMQEWEQKVHNHLASIIDAHPDMFKNGTDVAKGILNGSDDAIKGTLKAFGVPTDKLSAAEVDKLRKQIASFYDKNAKTKGSSLSTGKKGNTKASKKKENTKASKKKGISKKKLKELNSRKAIRRPGTDYDPDYNQNVNKNREKKTMAHSRFCVIDSDSLIHNGILGMRWGKRNGPPYPLKSGDHSASEKKMGWHKSLFGKKNEELYDRNQGSSSSSNGSSSSSSNSSQQSQQNNQQPQRQERTFKNALKEARKENVNKLSTQDLRDYNNRLQAEKQFNDLTKKQESEGKKYVKEIAKRAFETIVVATAIEIGKEYFKKSLSKKIASAAIS